MKSKKLKSYRDGHRAEKMAALLLRLKGYKILETRYKTPVGEIDLIARRGRALVFVEVKLRNNEMAALEAVTPKNQSRVAQASQHYLSRHPEYAGFNMRFDIVVMAWPFFWRHLDNAWQAHT